MIPRLSRLTKRLILTLILVIKDLRSISSPDCDTTRNQSAKKGQTIDQAIGKRLLRMAGEQLSGTLTVYDHGLGPVLLTTNALDVALVSTGEVGRGIEQSDGPVAGVR